MNLRRWHHSAIRLQFYLRFTPRTTLYFRYATQFHYDDFSLRFTTYAIAADIYASIDECYCPGLYHYHCRQKNGLLIRLRLLQSYILNVSA